MITVNNCVCVCDSHMPLSPAADTKHDRPRQQAVTNGNPTGSAVARDDDGEDTPPGNSIVVRIGIPDLQQTVTHTHAHTLHFILRTKSLEKDKKKE